MNTEKSRLDKMLQENKISKKEYDILATALKRKRFFNKVHSTFLLNPFQKIAGWKALLIGMMVIILTSAIAVKAKLYFLGPMSTINASVLGKQSITSPFFFMLYQNMICWLVLSILLMLTAKVLQKHKIRIVDFLGTVALARIPTLIATLYLMVVRMEYPSVLEIDLSHGYQLHYSIAQYILTLPVIILAIWQAVIYFYAFKESSGLTGKKLTFGFLAAIILAETVAQPITTLFMN
ncbi:MAG: hypothetical protein P1U32_05060 [Legionellaceae bacterium]|nr:hypothetical protein [Legionellaceae bacterium]